MKIDIWSDIMCPFCYIGKRRLEGALSNFEGKENVEVIWHSFQLDPSMSSEPGKDLYTYLAERKGQSREWAVKVHGQMAENAKQDGLEYNFDKAIIANSFDAHRLIHLAKKSGLGDAAKEALLKAYFTEGRNMADHNTLMQIGINIGLNAVDIGDMLNTDACAEEVRKDIAMANEIGISGVPFFIINNKYAISGAQPKEVFSQALVQAWTEYKSDLKNITTIEGDVCTTDGACTPAKQNNN